jgi:hypothetical protein
MPPQGPPFMDAMQCAWRPCVRRFVLAVPRHKSRNNQELGSIDGALRPLPPLWQAAGTLRRLAPTAHRPGQVDHQGEFVFTPHSFQLPTPPMDTRWLAFFRSLSSSGILPPRASSSWRPLGQIGIQRSTFSPTRRRYQSPTPTVFLSILRSRESWRPPNSNSKFT